jgi:hypothetical protein
MRDRTEFSYLTRHSSPGSCETRHVVHLGHSSRRGQPNLLETLAPSASGTPALQANRPISVRFPLRSLLASRDPHLMHTGYRAHGGPSTAYFEGGPYVVACTLKYWPACLNEPHCATEECCHNTVAVLATAIPQTRKHSKLQFFAVICLCRCSQVSAQYYAWKC